MSSTPPKKEGRTIAEVLKTNLRRLVLATVILYLLAFGIGYYVYTIARDTNNSLCTFRDDVSQRVEASKQFLIDHPEGSGEITPEVLKATIRQGDQTIAALSNLDCPAPPNLSPSTPTPTP